MHKELFDEKIISVLQVFFSRKHDLSPTQVSHLTGLPRSTVWNILGQLVSSEILDVNVFGKTKYYSLSSDEHTSALIEFLLKHGYLDKEAVRM